MLTSLLDNRVKVCRGDGWPLGECVYVTPCLHPDVSCFPRALLGEVYSEKTGETQPRSMPPSGVEKTLNTMIYV